MTGVVFFYEDNVANRNSGREIDVQVWRETIKPLGGDLMIMVDTSVSGSTYQHTDEEIKFVSFKSLDEALTSYPKASWVFLAPEVSIPGSPVYNKIPGPRLPYSTIDKFSHPAEDVIYVIGPDSTGLDLSKIPMPKTNHILAIPTPRHHDLWSFIVAAIVLFDRKTKLKQWQ